MFCKEVVLQLLILVSMLLSKANKISNNKTGHHGFVDRDNKRIEGITRCRHDEIGHDGM
jgi:hypothetical protein